MVRGEPEKYGDTAQPAFRQIICAAEVRQDAGPRAAKRQIRPGARQGGCDTVADGRQTCFMGSANETKSAWKLNYELVWEDDSREGIDWVQEEFDALWNHPCAVPLGEFVIEDIGRLVKREVVRSVEVWRQDPNEASAVIETPVYRREYGLWEQPKIFRQAGLRRPPRPARRTFRAGATWWAWARQSNSAWPQC